MKHFSLLPLLALLALPLSAQTTLTDADLQNAYKSETYAKRISCHDPSIVVDNVSNPNFPVYYIYGSHLGHGRTYQSSNYKSWDDSWAAYETTGTNNSLFADANGNLINYSQAYSSSPEHQVKNYKGETVTLPSFDAHGWQFKGNNVQGMQWAPDVIYNKQMKKWCMYMSLNGDNWCSSIVLFTSDKVSGPWQYQGPVVISGFSGYYDHNSGAKANDWERTDLANATGATSLPTRYNVGRNWSRYWPNCIDPCVFYDDDDNLWMSYGSWFGGIFLLKLDAATGLRDYTHTYPYQEDGIGKVPNTASQACTSDPYFGKKIAGGYSVSGEGSYIKKIGSHWFLFLSYGGLTSTGGYQMRIFRADKPDGPYKDAYGTSAIYKSYVVNFGSNGKDNRGVLLFGGYQWDTMPTAELAQGHNSAFIDDKGRAFVVYHTRFNDGTEGHQVRVHQLFLNEDDWLVAAPYEFNGETITNEAIASSASIDDSEIPGSYQFIRHQYNQSEASKAYEKPVNITLKDDGTITGASNNKADKWTRKAGTDFITLTINNVNYKGVLVRQQIDYTNIPALCIAAISDDSGNLTIGQSSFTYQQEVWASKADAKAAIKYTVDHISVPFTDGATINENTNKLPTNGMLGTSVSWTSSDPTILRIYGSSATIRGAGPVVVTMTISKDGYNYTKEYSLNVDKNAEASTPVYYPESQTKDLTAGWWQNFSNYYAIKAGSSAEFKFYNYSDKVNNWDNWVLGVANKERNTNGYTEYLMLRADAYGWATHYDVNNITKDWSDWDKFRADMDGALVDMTITYNKDGSFKMTATMTATNGTVYNYGYTMNITELPSSITVFFINEKSYIDGSGLATGISNIRVDGDKASDGRTYNLNGQQVGKDYRGVVIRNGKKIILK